MQGKRTGRNQVEERVIPRLNGRYWDVEGGTEEGDGAE